MQPIVNCELKMRSQLRPELLYPAVPVEGYAAGGYIQTTPTAPDTVTQPQPRICPDVEEGLCRSECPSGPKIIERSIVNIRRYTVGPMVEICPLSHPTK